jgi:hypothetical protein
MAFDQSGLRWLGISDLIAEPEALPSSPIKLRAAVWTGYARDTRPAADIGEIGRWQKTFRV